MSPGVPNPPESAVSRLTAEVLTDWRSVDALETAWNPLLRKTPADTVFLTWEWLQAWLDVSGRRHPPLVIVVRDEAGQVQGIAPFYVATYRLLGILKYRVLRIVADWPTGAEYQDLLVAPALEEEVLRCITSALQERRKSWDCIWMPKLSGWTGVRERLTRIADYGQFHYSEREMTFGWVDLPSSQAEYEGQMSADRRQQLRRRCRQVESRPGVKLGRCEDESQLVTYLAALFRLHGQRWGSLGQGGVFVRKPEEARFYERFAPVALKSGWLRIFGLFEGDTAKAVQLGYVYNDIFLQIQEGFDPAYQAGAGNVLRRHAIASCIQEGLVAYDFMGDMTDHKSRWLARQRIGHDIFMAHRSLKNAILFRFGIWPTGRYFRVKWVDASSQKGALAHGV